MAKKPAPKKAPAKKPVAAKKPAAPAKKPASVKKAPPPAKKATPAAKKPAPATKAVASKVAAKPKPKPPGPAPAAQPKKPEPAPAMKPVFETLPPAPAARPAEPSAPPKVVMKTGANGGTALTIAAQASAGAAANGNTHPANILVLVSSGGWPVTDLTKDHFTLMEYFEVPGQQAPFSNNITSFRNVGTGAYLLQVRPINGAPWRTGHHLAQILVSSADDRQGQAAVKLIIR